jgi:predicted RNA-binding protein with PIN domain
MSSYLIVDGYNIIAKLPSLVKAKRKSIEFARARLCELIEAYCDYNGAKGTIVFDGGQREQQEEGDNPKVIFSKKGESADTIIESLVYNCDDKINTRVVTDDRAIRNMVVGMGASCISINMFEDELKSVLSSMKDIVAERECRINKGIKL